MMEAGQQTPETSDNISKLLAVGKNVKTRIYAELVSRVGAGEILNAQEIATFDKLHRELSGEDSKPMGPSLPNRAAVATYLRNRGYKVSKSAVYKHQEEGKLRPQADGSYTVTDAETYARLYLPRLDGTRTDLDEVQREKLAEETRKTRAQAHHWELRAAEAAGALVPADWREKDLSARAIVLRSDFSNFVHSEAGSIIALVKGDVDMVPDLIAFMLAGGERWFARYTGDREFTAELPAPSAAPAAAAAAALDDMGDDE